VNEIELFERVPIPLLCTLDEPADVLRRLAAGALLGRLGAHVVRLPRLAGTESDAARAAEALEIGDLRHDDMVRAVLALEDDDARPVLVQRPFEQIGGGGVDEPDDHLSALEAELDPNADFT
jgi:hypothetical protein